MPQSPRFFAVDTAFLLELQCGNEHCAGLIDVLSRLGFFPLASDAVLLELNEIRLNGSGKARLVAKDTIQGLVNWSILQPSLSPVHNGVAAVLAGRIVQDSLLAEFNDALIIAEAACHNCSLLVAEKSEINKADREKLLLLLARHDVSVIRIFSTAEVLVPA